MTQYMVYYYQTDKPEAWYFFTNSREAIRWAMAGAMRVCKRLGIPFVDDGDYAEGDIYTWTHSIGEKVILIRVIEVDVPIPSPSPSIN